MAFCCFFWGGETLRVFKKSDSSFLFVDSLHLSLGRLWPRCLGLGADREGGNNAWNLYEKKKTKLESFPHVKLRLSSSCSQMSCDG